MTKLLIITMSFPFPLRAGGKVRVYNLIKQLSKEYNITLISLATAEEERFIAELEKFCKRVLTVPLAERGSYRLLHLLRCLVSMGKGMPAEMTLKAYSSFRRILVQTLSEEFFDLIQVEFVQMLPYILSDDLTDSVQRIIWVEHEVLHRRLFKRSEAGRGFWRWFWQREAHLTLEYEISAARRLKNAIAVSDEEVVCLQSWNPDLYVDLVPNGVDVAFYDAVSVRREPQSIIFIGWMRHFPNLDAASFLLKEVMPLIIQKTPNVRLYLVGGAVPDKIHTLAEKIPQVVMTGFVEDIRSLIKSASVTIVPLRIGGGTHLKVLEAMACRTPIVTTPVGAEGLPLKHGQHAWIARDAQGLAEGVERLLEDVRLRELMTTEARKLVEKEYDWAVIADKQKRFYRRVLDRFS